MKKIIQELESYRNILKKASTQDILENAIDKAFKGISVPAPAPVKKNITNNKSKDHLEHDHNHSKDKVTSPYGERVHPITGKTSFHGAVDLRAPEGAEIRAWESGTVASVGYGSASGNYVILRHKDGYSTSYSHLSKVNVSRGASVGKGEVIGLAGSTGNVTGPHLHFKMKVNGKTIDPTEHLKEVSLVGPVRERGVS